VGVDTADEVTAVDKEKIAEVSLTLEN